MYYPKSSAPELSLLISNAIADFAAEWSKKNNLTEKSVDDAMYWQFQDFVMKQNKDNDLKLDTIYSGTINKLKKSLEQIE